MPANTDGHCSSPKNIGILAISTYFPHSYVDQNELEQHDNVSSGKYTIGLGQKQMGFCHDNEDVCSLCLTAVSNLIERNEVSYNEIGRLEVGTETIVDKSKSVKSVLMQLFVESGNYDVEGVDSTNACYGGTAALFNSIAWMESSYWDGRYALVVCGDIAVYASGNARCTGGAGAVAMLIGPNAPLVFEQGLRSSYIRHAYDFYKPDLTSEYPTVDGKLSVECYITALDSCYQSYCTKAEKRLKLPTSSFSLQNIDYMLFHTPYCKLVQKSLARLVLNDVVRDTTHCYCDKHRKDAQEIQQFKDTSLPSCIFDRTIEKSCMTASSNIFNEKTSPSLLIARRVGNMYTPSLYGCLVSLLVSTSSEQLLGKRIALFSYGSGLAASMYSIKIQDTSSTRFTLDTLQHNLCDVIKKLDSRQKFSPVDFTKVLERREHVYNKCNYTPVSDEQVLFPSTFYLSNIDDKFRRTYKRKPSHDVVVTNGDSSMNGHH